MRRLVTVVGLLTLVLAVGACGTGGAHAALLSAPTHTPAPSRTPDPDVTDQVCQQATTAVAGASSSFALQLAVIDQAAAEGRPSAILLAADAIQNRLLALAGKLATWAKRPVQGSVRKALTGGAATLRAITASTYPGNQADIARQLHELSHALNRACG